MSALQSETVDEDEDDDDNVTQQMICPKKRKTQGMHLTDIFWGKGANLWS